MEKAGRQGRRAGDGRAVQPLRPARRHALRLRPAALRGGVLREAPRRPRPRRAAAALPGPALRATGPHRHGPPEGAGGGGRLEHGLPAQGHRLAQGPAPAGAVRPHLPRLLLLRRSAAGTHPHAGRPHADGLRAGGGGDRLRAQEPPLHRQPEPGAQPAERALLQHEVAAMRADDVARDGEAEAGAARRAALEGPEGALRARPPGMPGPSSSTVTCAQNAPPPPPFRPARPAERRPRGTASTATAIRRACRRALSSRLPRHRRTASARSGITSAPPFAATSTAAPARRALAATSCTSSTRSAGRACSVPSPRAKAR